MLEPEEFNKLLAEIKAKNLPTEQLMYELKDQNQSIMTVIKIVRETTDKDLNQAKHYVCHHPAWTGVVSNQKQFHRDLEKMILDLTK